jgi:hypothetical protein
MMDRLFQAAVKTPVRLVIAIESDGCHGRGADRALEDTRSVPIGLEQGDVADE